MLCGEIDEHRTLLEHGHNFAVIVFGAAVVYNQLLAEEKGKDALVEEHRETGRRWLERFDARLDDLIAWSNDLGPFWTAVSNTGHQIGAQPFRHQQQRRRYQQARYENRFQDRPSRLKREKFALAHHAV